MNQYEFTLNFKLPTPDEDPGELIARLGAAGCEDALIGVGVQGRVALEFTRKAPSAYEAVLSAVRDVHQAVPGADLIEVGPDLVGLTDVADYVDVTRQYMRKLVTTHFDFPSPVHGGQTQLWHLEPVLRWLQGHSYRIASTTLEIAQVAFRCNLERETENIEATGRFRQLRQA